LNKRQLKNTALLLAWNNFSSNGAHLVSRPAAAQLTPLSIRRLAVALRCLWRQVNPYPIAKCL
jgi:hypothetical protein